MITKTLVAAVALLTAGGTAAQAATFAPMLVQPARLIGAAAADQIALTAVKGGKVVLTQLDPQPAPLHYSVDILQPTFEFEVWVDARTGSVIKIIQQRR